MSAAGRRLLVAAEADGLLTLQYFPVAAYHSINIGDDAERRKGIQPNGSVLRPEAAFSHTSSQPTATR